MNYLGFKKEKLQPTANALNMLLANYQVYYQNLRNFHWNVTGENFFDLHDKFEELYEDARLKIDEIAERILTLRMRPMSTMQAYIETAEIEESGVVKRPAIMVDHILENHRILIENMRMIISRAGEVTDEGNIDMVGGFLAELEKKSWMLDAWRENALKPTPAEVK